MKLKYNLLDGTEATIIDGDKSKIMTSPNYNYLLNKRDGLFIRFGKTPEESPLAQLALPENLTILLNEIDGSGNELVMGLDTYKVILNKIPKSVAFINLDISFKYDHIREVIEESLRRGFLLNLIYNSDNRGANPFDVPNDFYGIKSINIRYGSQEETLSRVINIFEIINIDLPLYNNTYSYIMHILKEYGKNDKITSFNFYYDDNLGFKEKMDKLDFLKIVNYLSWNDIPFNMHSCLTKDFLEFSKVNFAERYEDFENSVPLCDTAVYSGYIDTFGKFFNFKDENSVGFDIVKCDDFINDIWNDESTKIFRNEIVSCKNCKTNCKIYRGE